MGAVFTIGDQSGEILDLTAPATERDGIVARWLRDALARDTSTTPHPPHPARPEADEPAV